jgi:hypothetical protein
MRGFGEAFSRAWPACMKHAVKKCVGAQLWSSATAEKTIPSLLLVVAGTLYVWASAQRQPDDQ